MDKRVVRTGGFLLVLLSLLVIPSQHARAGSSAPECYDPRTSQTYTATKWLDAPGTLTGTNKADVLVGSTGADVIKGLGGNDIICTSPDANDEEGDIVDGGAGNDSIYGVGYLKGGTGNDYIEGYLNSKVEGGSGNDEVFVQDGGTADGGSGNDYVLGVYADALLGGSGNDRVGNIEGYPLMDCGTGIDYYAPNGTSPVRRCEREVDYCELIYPSINAISTSDFEAQC